MYHPPKFEEVKFLIGLKVVYLSLGMYMIDIVFEHNINPSLNLSTYIEQPKLVVGQPKLVNIDGLSISSVEDYSKLLQFIDKKVTAIKICDDLFSVILENGNINITLESNGYEIFEIRGGKELIIV